MRIYKLIIFTALPLMIFTGCKKEFDINTNPNTVTESNITPELILPNALYGVGVQTSLGYGFLSNWMGYWSPSGSYAPNTEESTYNLTPSFGEGKWDGIYNVLFDLDNVEKKSVPAKKVFYVAVAKIMKAHLFQNLVDIYGNVPYSQAFSAQNPSPVYDKAEDIYKDLQVQLDSATAMLKSGAAPSAASTIDVVFFGDTQKWIKLANTLKLRILIRQSEVTGFSPTAELAKITANGGVLPSQQTAQVTISFTNDIGKQNAYYAAYGLQPSGVSANEYYRANNYALNIYKNSSDPRLGYFYAKATAPANTSNPYVGTTYGGPTDDNFSGTKTSNIGPGLVKSYTQPQWIVTSVESLFLQAEAVARGWFPGNARTAYENAVRESFIWLGVSDAVNAANTYLGSATVANFDNAGATAITQAKFIVNQKYLALNGINPLEAWSDYRRLSVPSNLAISVNPAKVSGTLPVRLPYPASEVAVNSKNVPSGINQFSSRIFWDIQ